MLRSQRFWVLALLLLSCKEPVEDQVAPPPLPPPVSVPRLRGQPPPEARAYVLKEAPPIRYPLKATFEDQIALLGYDLPKTSFRPGEPVPLTLFWKALVDVPENWQVFIHLDPEGIDSHEYRGYGDHYPVFGFYPPIQWKKGEIVRDQVTVTLRENVRTPKADLWIGFYIGARRAKVKSDLPTDGRDRLKMVVLDVGQGAAKGGPQYPVYRATGKISIDGRLDDPDWQKAPSTGPFRRTMGGGPAKFDTWAKLLWDDENLYVAFFCADPDIRTPFQKRDDPLWKADAVEIFLDPEGKGQRYMELQVSPANVIFDAYFSKRSSPPDRAPDLGFNPGIRTAVRVDGTLNQPGDRDRSWTVEMAIPLKDLRNTPRTPPTVGSNWRANFVRIERTSGEIDDSAWSPPGDDYHNPDAMGTLVFSGPPGSPPPQLKAKITQDKGRLRLLQKQILKREMPRPFPKPSTEGEPLMSVPPP
jgi:hypothetical protein